MYGVQVHSTSGAAGEAAQSAAAQAEAALQAAKDKAAQTASQVCPYKISTCLIKNPLLRAWDTRAGRPSSWHP